MDERQSPCLAIVGHDLRAPLIAMVLAARMIEGAEDPIYMRRLAAMISREGLEMGARLDRLLDFADEWVLTPPVPVHKLVQLPYGTSTEL